MQNDYNITAYLSTLWKCKSNCNCKWRKSNCNRNWKQSNWNVIVIELQLQSTWSNCNVINYFRNVIAPCLIDVNNVKVIVIVIEEKVIVIVIENKVIEM